MKLAEIKPREARGSVGIRLGPNAHNTKIINNKFRGFDVGIESNGAKGLVVEGTEFDRVQLPYKLRGEASVSATKITGDPKIRTSVGWRAAIGPALPSFCKACDSVFASQNYDMAGAYFFLWDNEDTCIRCGNEHARLSQGHFDLAREAVKILRAPDVTHEMVARLSEIGWDTFYGKLNNNEAIAAVDEVAPAFGNVARSLLQAGIGTFLFYASVVGAISATWDLAERVGLTDVAVVEQKILEEVLRSHEQRWHQELLALGRKIASARPMGVSTNGLEAESTNAEHRHRDERFEENAMPRIEIGKTKRQHPK